MLEGNPSSANSLTESQNKRNISGAIVAKSTEFSPFGGHVHALAINPPLNNKRRN
jgi:hypothetical protein